MGIVINYCMMDAAISSLTPLFLRKRFGVLRLHNLSKCYGDCRVFQGLTAHARMKPII